MPGLNLSKWEQHLKPKSVSRFFTTCIYNASRSDGNFYGVRITPKINADRLKISFIRELEQLGLKPNKKLSQDEFVWDIDLPFINTAEEAEEFADELQKSP